MTSTQSALDLDPDTDLLGVGLHAGDDLVVLHTLVSALFRDAPLEVVHLLLQAQVLVLNGGVSTTQNGRNSHLTKRLPSHPTVPLRTEVKGELELI